MQRSIVALNVSFVLAACAGGSGTIGDPAGGGTSSSSGSSGGGVQNGGGVGGGGGSGGGSADAGPDAPPNPAGCPAAYESAGNCTIGLVCNYPQGRCECADYCGGAAPPEGDHSHWVCRPKLDNGCPDSPPTPGGSCSIPTSCDYGPCCVQTFTCTGGSWKGGAPVCPP